MLHGPTTLGNRCWYEGTLRSPRGARHGECCGAPLRNTGIAWPPSGEESDEQIPALTARKMNAEEADPARGAADRPRQDGGASVNFRDRSAAITSALRVAAKTTAVAVMAVATAVVDGNAA